MTSTLRLLPYGDRGLLAEPDHAAAVLPLADGARSLPGVREVVPGARTVLVLLTDPHASRDVADALRGLAMAADPRPRVTGTELVVEVTYDGADLADTAAEVGLDADGLVRAHSGCEYVVAFCGFAPGFAYLNGLDETLHVPRHAEPRTRVPAGSVAIAGEFTGVYPRPSPGGWRLLGRTDAELWRLDRDPPALLAPGTRVRFRPR